MGLGVLWDSVAGYGERTISQKRQKGSIRPQGSKLVESCICKPQEGDGGVLLGGTHEV